MTGKFLGKITSAEFGRNKDRGFLLGLQLSFAFNGYGVEDFFHLVNMSEPTEYHNFSAEEQEERMIVEFKFVYELLKDAKCSYISELVNKPVEVIIEDGMLKKFRILTEVL